MYSKGIVLRKWKNRKMKDTLYYHRITESEKYIISSWKYIGKESVYNRPSYEEDKKTRTGFADDANHFYSFYEGGNLIGYINLREKENGIWFGIGVNPTCCGQGYGQRIIVQAFGIAKKLFGDKRLYLEVRTWNKRAIRCYEKCGFQIVGDAFGKCVRNGEDKFWLMMNVDSRIQGE